MDLNVLFFASYRELVGVPALSLSLTPGSTVAELVESVRAKGDDFQRLPARPAVAVNHVVVAPEHILENGDEVAFLPPVAGG